MKDKEVKRKRAWDEDYDDGLIEGIHFPESQDDVDEAYEERRAKRKARLEDNKNGGEARKAILREIKEDVILLVCTIAVVLALNSFVIINAKIPSASMENTVMEGDRIFGLRLAYLFDDPARYDIIIFRYPDDEEVLFIKRIIGLPGESVLIRDGKVYIDESEVALDDSFCPEVPEGNYGPYLVPEGHYFVMGDNRQHSNDSRFWDNHFVSADQIVGQAGLRYWPISKLGLVH